MTTPIEERVARLEGGYEHLATKADVESLRADLKADIGAVRADFKGDLGAARADFKADIGAVRADFKADLVAVQTDINRRIDRLFWAVLGIGGGLLAAAVAALVRTAF